MFAEIDEGRYFSSHIAIVKIFQLIVEIIDGKVFFFMDEAIQHELYLILKPTFWLDSKSNRLCPCRFESCSVSFFFPSTYEFLFLVWIFLPFFFPYSMFSFFALQPFFILLLFLSHACCQESRHQSMCGNISAHLELRTYLCHILLIYWHPPGFQ